MNEYDERLGRALEETAGVAGESERFRVPDPELRPEGNATVYENFRATAERLDRDPSLLLTFLQSELGTSAHVDERGRARLIGSFDGERVGDAIASFVEAYVRCPECGLPDTRLVEENGVEMKRCDACGALSPTG